eukprot:TRINITY_DN7423_c1_g1_i1.p1 TRINITY_DN7423_c1_g1~~TRINITY_DN7423_c1_g1_i1.p1  ORF type:complete len:173 (-),score=25.85 TRINITY_DN7423_c1_g1_i1:106-624(-)
MSYSNCLVQRKSWSSSLKGKNTTFCNYRRCQKNLRTTTCSFGPKTGMVGEARFQQDAIAGTYWYEGESTGEIVKVIFECQKGELETEVQSGENLLKVAEAVGAVKQNQGFCYEGTCETCVFECDGAMEVGQRASKTSDGFVRSCITPVPQSNEQSIRVKVLSDEDVWGESML